MLILVVLSGCSTKKNTLLSRTYHQVISHYNIFFNGNESFKKGVDRINKQYEYDYTRILPVFIYNDADLAKTAGADMDRAISKASKIITTKSITAKPKKPKRQLSKKETEYIKQNEYNRWVIESYLLMGKAHFYKHDFSSAIKTFQFMQNEYPESQAIWPAQIWLSRAYLETGRYRDAKMLLDKLSVDGRFPGSMNGNLSATYADYYLKQNEISNSIPRLKIALHNTSVKKEKIRYTYILAQLYGKINDPLQANEYFGKVLKLNPPYEMVFNAKISLALSADSRTKDDAKTSAGLKKMLRDDKNRDYEDQIYFALGNIAMRNGNQTEAIEFFQKSSETGNSDSPQKIVTNLTLAEIALKKPDYVKASEHYEKAVAIIKIDYPGHEAIVSRSKNLSNLAGNIRSFRLEDSVQVLARMTESERDQVIDQIIAKIRQAETDERIAEASMRKEQQEKYMRTAPISQMQAERAGDGKWYFYNQTAVNFGIAEFESVWGKRKLEDNWRRSNKQVLTIDQPALIAAEVPDDETQTPGHESSHTSRDFYIKNIPLTPEKLEKSHEKIKESLFNMGKIFKNDIKDYPQSVWAYEELNKRYPDHSRITEVLYDLHEVNLLAGNFSRAEYYKNQIVNRYPQSVYANILNNPNYFRDLIEKEERIEKFYQETYLYHQRNMHSEVVRNANFAISNYSESSLIPKFLFLKAVSTNKLGDAALFRSQLTEIIEKFPGTDVQESSKELLILLDKDRPEIAEKKLVEEAKEIYSTSQEGVHYVVFATKNNSVIINQLVFNLINFNIDFFNRLNLKVTAEEFSPDEQLLKILDFKNNVSSYEYYSTAIKNTELAKDLPDESYKLFYISEKNLQVLLKDKIVEKYLRFFELQVLKK